MSDWPKVQVDLPEGYSHCFACGNDNHIGLKIKFDTNGNSVSAIVSLDERYQGWPGYLHGGVIGTMLDEAMSWAANQPGYKCVTAEYNVKLKRLTPVNHPLRLTGKIVKKTRKIIKCVSSIELEDGTVVAEGKATHFVTDTETPEVK